MEHGKTLEELIFEVDVQRKALEATSDNNSCICWQEDETLAAFDPSDGFPMYYWREYHDAPHNNREDFTSLSSFIRYMKRFASDDYVKYLLTAPVWQTIETHSQAERDAFHTLLGNIVIDL